MEPLYIIAIVDTNPLQLEFNVLIKEISVVFSLCIRDLFAVSRLNLSQNPPFSDNYRRVSTVQC